MKRTLRIAMRLLVVVAIVLAGLAIWKRDEIKRLLAVNSLFAEDRIVANFSGMDAAFLTVPVLAGTDTSALPQGPATTLPDTATNWIKDRHITGLVVLKDGQIAAEQYHHSTAPDDLRINWSVSKSYLSALLGVLIARGEISTIDERVTHYVPALKGSAYNKATIKDVLQMSSGVRFNEDYLDQSSDINRMGRVLALGRSMDGFTQGLIEQDAEPGARWQYVSIDTHVIGMVIRGATGRSIPDLLSEHIIGPMGVERAPYFLTDGYGVSFVLGGLNTTTRDNARFGQMIAQGGQWNGQQIVPADWISESTGASAKTAQGAIGYGYQWWVPEGSDEGQFMARGIYGQYIFIDRTRNVVIAVHAADRGFRQPGVADQNIAMFRAIAQGFD